MEINSFKLDKIEIKEFKEFLDKSKRLDIDVFNARGCGLGSLYYDIDISNGEEVFTIDSTHEIRETLIDKFKSILSEFNYATSNVEGGYTKFSLDINSTDKMKIVEKLIKRINSDHADYNKRFSIHQVVDENTYIVLNQGAAYSGSYDYGLPARCEALYGNTLKEFFKSVSFVERSTSLGGFDSDAYLFKVVIKSKKAMKEAIKDKIFSNFEEDKKYKLLEDEGFSNHILKKGSVVSLKKRWYNWENHTELFVHSGEIKTTTHTAHLRGSIITENGGLCFYEVADYQKKFYGNDDITVVDYDPYNGIVPKCKEIS